jgi:hypothetical protein
MLGASSSIVEHFGALIPHVADFRMGVVLEHSSGFERTKTVLWRSLDFFAIERTLVVFRVKDGRHPVVYRSQDRIGGHRDNCITLKPLTVCRILPSIGPWLLLVNHDDVRAILRWGNASAAEMSKHEDSSPLPVTERVAKQHTHLASFEARPIHRSPRRTFDGRNFRRSREV